MFPLLLRIDAFELWGMDLGPWEVHWYGTLITIGFLLGLWVAVREAKRVGVDPDRVMDLAFWFLLAGLIGSRVMFDIVNWRNYYDACFDPAAVGRDAPACYEILKIWEGGLVWYGGLLGAIVVGLWYMHRHRMPILKTCDAMAPSVALGHAFGRMGCFCAGCCFGRPTQTVTGVLFPSDSMAHRLQTERWPELLSSLHHSLPIHPTQIYESLGEIAIFATLLLWRSRKRFHGQIFMAYLILYAVLRSIVEFFRGDHARGYLVQWEVTHRFGEAVYRDVTGLSTSQLISLLVAAMAVTVMALLIRRRNQQMLPDQVETAPPKGPDGRGDPV